MGLETIHPSCENCNGGCCSDIHMVLDATELRLLINNGADVRNSSGLYATLELAEMMGSSSSLFYLMGKCPFLQDGQCRIFGLLDRPGCCDGFQVGCDECKRRFDQIG